MGIRGEADKLIDAIKDIKIDPAESGDKKNPEWKITDAKKAAAGVPSLEKEAQRLEDEFGIVDKRIEKLKKEKTPTHEEIMNAWEFGTLKQKLEVDFALANNALEAYGTPPYDLDSFVELTDNMDFDKLKGAGGFETGVPIVYYRKIKSDDGDEVKLIIDLNNDERNKNKNTMITANIMLVEGKIQEFKLEEKHCLAHITTQEEVEEAFETTLKQPHKLLRAFGLGSSKLVLKNNDFGSKQIRGEYAIDDYLIEYQKNYKQTLTESWEKHDIEIVKDTRNASVEGNKATLVDKISTNYTEILKDVESAKSEKIGKYMERAVEITKSYSEVIEGMMNFAISMLIKKDNESDKDHTTRVNNFIKFTASCNKDLTEEDIRGIVSKIIGL